MDTTHCTDAMVLYLVFFSCLATIAIAAKQIYCKIHSKIIKTQHRVFLFLNKALVRVYWMTPVGQKVLPNGLVRPSIRT